MKYTLYYCYFFLRLFLKMCRNRRKLRYPQGKGKDQKKIQNHGDQRKVKQKKTRLGLRMRRLVLPPQAALSPPPHHLLGRKPNLNWHLLLLLIWYTLNMIYTWTYKWKLYYLSLAHCYINYTNTQKCNVGNLFNKNFLCR